MKNMISVNRREFVRHGIVSALAASAAACGSSSTNESQSSSTQDFEVVDNEAYEFWTGAATQNADQPQTISESGETESQNPLPASSAGLVAPTRSPTFLVYTKDAGFRLPTDVSQSELIDQGDVKIELKIAGFKPSEIDRSAFLTMKNGSLRIDVKQRPTSPDMLAYVWSAVAAVIAEDDKLPDLPDLRLDVGDVWGNQLAVTLPSGKGEWTWNFFCQRRNDSPWSKILKILGAGSKVLFPVFGLPSIAVSAFDKFSEFFGKVTANSLSEWIFNARPVTVVGTKRAFDDELPGALPLINGASYLVVPQDHLSSFGGKMNDLVYRPEHGYIVPKNTADYDTYKIAPETVKDVTYIALNMKVTKIS